VKAAWYNRKESVVIKCGWARRGRKGKKNRNTQRIDDGS
jgi:hypothetical protein